MTKILKYLYTAWAVFWVIFIFLLIFPITFICLQKEQWKPYAHYLNRVWGKIYFFMIGIPLEIEYKQQLDSKKAYVFCFNHFSYIDIAVFGMVIKNYTAFVGKSDLKGIPLFGYMFAKLHIQVDRSNKNSRIKSLSKSIKALQNGRSIAIAPEGGIKYKNFPTMHTPLKDGAFAMAIQQQVPIVPISYLNNHEILDSNKMLNRKPIKVIVHEAISTQGMTNDDLETLKAQTLEVIQTALNQAHKHQAKAVIL
ncbi:MAG: 1-acyl-sn-glycerol-3-phosphate acyltransferase [Pseudarcicella sp.]|nr:1-acyl-sn-glycerol-3-phosphate acyltransferase [Pseudarcicella sp.]